MDKFGSIQGETYELGGLAGTLCALRAFKLSEICEQQIARITSQLGDGSLATIYRQFNKKFVGSSLRFEPTVQVLPSESLQSAHSVLNARLFQGYVQGFCETRQFVKSLPCRGRPVIAWIYANPPIEKIAGVGSEPAPALSPERKCALARQELSQIANLSDFGRRARFPCQKGEMPYADILFIIRTFHNDAYHFHLICYELSAHTSPTLDTELNLSDPDDIYESLRRGKAMMSKAIKTRDFQIASGALGLEFSPDLKNYFQGLATHDKIAKKLFQGGGYLASLYGLIKDRIISKKPFDRWVTGKGNIEFHIVAFTDRGRHFLHVREDEALLLREMGMIYKGIHVGSSLRLESTQGLRLESTQDAGSSLRLEPTQEKHKLRENEILTTQRAVLRNIKRNASPELRNNLNLLYKRAEQTFLGKTPLPDYLTFGFTEKIDGYAPTGTAPTTKQLHEWLPPNIADHLCRKPMKSMQDAHAELVRYIWHNSDDTDIYVLSGTPGIGKTTALRNILAQYPHSYLLIYVSPRLQVNTDLIAKFDPTYDENGLAGKDEMICLYTNSTLIKAAGAYHGKSALSCRSRRDLPKDRKFLFLSPDEAEVLESQPLYPVAGEFHAHPDKVLSPIKIRKSYKNLEKGGAGEGKGFYPPGVFNTMMQAVHRLVDLYHYKRIIACVTTQSNRQLEQNVTTFNVHLKKIFGTNREPDIASVEKFASHVNEVIFFIDEVTGDSAGCQTAQEMIEFQKEMKKSFRLAGKSLPLKFRMIIADASLINASSVAGYLNETRSQPDQIRFDGNADSKGLSLEKTKIRGVRACIINANVYPASSLTLRWRPVLDFWQKEENPNGLQRPLGSDLSKAYRHLEERLLMQLAQELVERWQQKPKEQSIVIIQDKLSVDTLKEYVLAYARIHTEESPDVISLHSFTHPAEKRRWVSPVSEAEKKRKKREVPVSQYGDLADIIIMTSSGTRGISFPNATKIICIVPTFSLENNFMEFLQGMYRGRGAGKGNQLDREIEIIIQQVLLVQVSDLNHTTVGSSLPPQLVQVRDLNQRLQSDIFAEETEQIVNLFATQMMMRMSILTRIFGACDLFGKSIACIPISGSLVQGASQTTMDKVSGAIRSLEHAYRQDPANKDLWYVTQHLRDIFQNETVILSHNGNHSKTLISTEYRNRLLHQFTHDANKGLNIIATREYLPEECYTVGELLLQSLHPLREQIREQNTHRIDTHLQKTRQILSALCTKLSLLAHDPNTVNGIRNPANELLPILNVLAEESESDTESETKGSLLNRWLVVPLSAMYLDDFWKNQADPPDFKTRMKAMLETYFQTYICHPNYPLPLKGLYHDKVPPWLLTRGPEIARRLDAQFRTRYVISSRSLALLNMMLLGKSIRQKGQGE